MARSRQSRASRPSTPNRGPIGKLFRLTKVTVTTASAAGPLVIDGLDKLIAQPVRQRGHGRRPGLQGRRHVTADPFQPAAGPPADIAGPPADVAEPPAGLRSTTAVADAQALLRWMPHLARQQDRSGAGAKCEPLCANSSSIKKMAPLQKLEHGGQLSAGNDQPVQTVQLLDARLHRLSAGISQASACDHVVSLNRQYPNPRMFRR